MKLIVTQNQTFSKNEDIILLEHSLAEVFVMERIIIKLLIILGIIQRLLTRIIYILRNYLKK